jgi:hypothetical protein
MAADIAGASGDQNRGAIRLGQWSSTRTRAPSFARV